MDPTNHNIDEPGHEAKHRPPDKLRKWADKLSANRAKLKHRAEEVGLKQFPSEYSRVWVDQDYAPGTLPARFFLEQYMGDGEPRLEEYHIALPINDIPQLVETVKAVDALYFGVTEALQYSRHGIEGLIEFLDDLTGTRPE